MSVVINAVFLVGGILIGALAGTVFLSVIGKVRWRDEPSGE
jgi:hypothetical protein